MFYLNWREDELAHEIMTTSRLHGAPKLILSPALQFRRSISRVIVACQSLGGCPDVRKIIDGYISNDAHVGSIRHLASRPLALHKYVFGPSTAGNTSTAFVIPPACIRNTFIDMHPRSSNTPSRGYDDSMGKGIGCGWSGWVEGGEEGGGQQSGKTN